MNYTESFKVTNNLCSFSPDGILLANVVNRQLIVRNAKSLQTLQHIVGIFGCTHNIQYIEWSPDSTMIWSVENPDWTCKIDEGSVGLVDARWSPDSRHILTTCEFYLRITLWSLVNKSVMYIKYPKQCKSYIDFSKDEKYLAVAERRECKDYISYFNCFTWDLVKNFSVDTENLDGIKWSPSDDVLCVWESCLSYKVLIYSLNGSCLSSFSAYDYALGIKSISWSPSGQILAVGSYDGKIRLLNHLTWRLICDFSHVEDFNLYNEDVIVYKETSVTDDFKQSIRKYEIVPINSVQNLQILSSSSSSSNTNSAHSMPKIGVSSFKFSHDCRYIASKEDSIPTVVFIWSLMELKCVAVLIHLQPVKSMSWNSENPTLAICTGSSEFFQWSPDGALTVPIRCGNNGGFVINEVKWANNGGSSPILLISKDEMCLAFYQ